MQRRKFVQQSLLTGASIFTAATVGASEKTFYKTAAEKPFNLDYGFHDGMFKNSAGAEFTDQIKFGYDMGFRSIEDNGYMGRTVDQQKKIGETLTKLGMRMGVFVVGFDK